MVRWLLPLLMLLAVTACEQKPANTGPTVHCFDETTGQWRLVTMKQDVNTGKITVTCPVGP
jgi:hypothetical protein